MRFQVEWVYKLSPDFSQVHPEKGGGGGWRSRETHIGCNVVWQRMNIVGQLDLWVDKSDTFTIVGLIMNCLPVVHTGFGIHSEGDLIKGTVAAAAYCCDTGPAHQSCVFAQPRIHGQATHLCSDLTMPLFELLTQCYTCMYVCSEGMDRVGRAGLGE